MQQEPEIKEQGQKNKIQQLLITYKDSQAKLFNEIKSLLRDDEQVSEKAQEKKQQSTEKQPIDLKQQNEQEQDLMEKKEKNKVQTLQQKDQHRKNVELHQKVNEKIIELLIIERKIEVINGADESKTQQIEEMLRIEAEKYNPTLEQIEDRKQAIVEDGQDSNWTDATDSQADEGQVWVVDEDEMQPIQESEQSQKDKQKENIDLGELQDQFVKGGESKHHNIFGDHEKFCVSVNGIGQRNILFSGGGDDYLNFYKLPKEENLEQMKPFHMVKHSQTINKIEVSHSKQYVFTLTDNEVLCTNLESLQTTSLKKKTEQSENPICSDICCHHLGDVIGLSADTSIEMYNIKGLKLYETYYCSHEITQMCFTDNGKQLCLACEDNRLRVLIPKTSEFKTITGPLQHQTEISAIKSRDNFLVSGCIDGYIGVASLSNYKMLSMIGAKQQQELYGSVNCLEFAGNFVVVGTVEDYLGWYDISKGKRVFKNSLKGSPTDIKSQEGKLFPHIYNASTIQGYIYGYDCRNPLQELYCLPTGNTVHKLWSADYHLAAACQDGKVRYFDIRKVM